MTALRWPGTEGQLRLSIPHPGSVRSCYGAVTLERGGWAGRCKAPSRVVAFAIGEPPGSAIPSFSHPPSLLQSEGLSSWGASPHQPTSSCHRSPAKRLKVQNGQITELDFLGSPPPRVGRTPDPCGLTGTLLGAAEPHQFANGARGTNPSRTRVFQLNEGRVGSTGQRVNATLNWCGGSTCFAEVANAPFTTPWIWSFVQFDLQGRRIAPVAGQPLPTGAQIFPSYVVYENGQEIVPLVQSDPEVFILLNSPSSELLPGAIP